MNPAQYRPGQGPTRPRPHPVALPQLIAARDIDIVPGDPPVPIAVWRVAEGQPDVPNRNRPAGFVALIVLRWPPRETGGMLRVPPAEVLRARRQPMRQSVAPATLLAGEAETQQIGTLTAARPGRPALLQRVAATVGSIVHRRVTRRTTPASSGNGARQRPDQCPHRAACCSHRAGQP
jgi:hypothetical protein